MTLEQWKHANPSAHVASYGRGNALQVFTRDLGNAARWDLHHLTDWFVSSSASGPSLILVPA